VCEKLLPDLPQKKMMVQTWAAPDVCAGCEVEMVVGRVRLAVAAVLFVKRHALVGVGRTLRSYRVLVPVALEYRSGLRRRRDPAAMAAMHERNAPRVLRMIHDLRGLYLSGVFSSFPRPPVHSGRTGTPRWARS